MKHISISLNDTEQVMLDEIILSLGYRQAEAIRAGIRLLYEKQVPKKKLKTPDAEEPKVMSAEEWAAEQGGDIIIKGDGQKFIKYMEGSMEVEKPVPAEYQ